MSPKRDQGRGSGYNEAVNPMSQAMCEAMDEAMNETANEATATRGRPTMTACRRNDRKSGYQADIKDDDAPAGAR